MKLTKFIGFVILLRFLRNLIMSKPGRIFIVFYLAVIIYVAAGYFILSLLKIDWDKWFFLLLIPVAIIVYNFKLKHK